MLARGRAYVGFQLVFLIVLQHQLPRVQGLCPPIQYGSNGLCYYDWYDDINAVNPCKCCIGQKRYWRGREGQHRDFSSNDCTPCETGKYQPVISSSTTCIDCPAGSYTASTGSFQCTLCEAGKYSLAGATGCTICTQVLKHGEGYLTGAASDAQCVIPAHIYCTQNSYCGTESRNYDFYKTCNCCPGEKFNSIFLNRNWCVSCEQNTYNPNQILFKSDALYIDQTATDPSAYVQCDSCPQGKLSGVRARRCWTSICKAGQYLVANAINIDCKSCAGGKFSTTTFVYDSSWNGDYGETLLAVGDSVCITCSAGKFSNAGASLCETCVAGKYSAANASVCTNCDAGKFSAAVGATAVDTCSSCQAGKYSDAGAYSCNLCVAGQESQTTTGETGVNAIDMCPPVPSAFWQRDARIFGQVFKSSWYSTDKRANGLWTIYSVKISESALLPAGVPGGSGIPWVAYVVDKVDYPWQITAPWNCWDKTELSWKSYPQMRFSTDICGDCAAGKYKEMPGNYSCIACPPNSYSPTKSSAVCDCNPGYTGSGSLNCTACEAGKYKDTQGSSLCTACPAKSISTTGSVNITDCKCNPGHTGADGGNCTACPQSTYKPLRGSGACTECATTHPNTAHALTGEINSTNCVCDAGYRLTTGVCESCPEGTYKIPLGDSLCLPCSGNSTSKPASTNPSACVCNAGYAPMQAQSSATPVLCSACIAGKFKNATSRAPSNATSGHYIESEKCQDCDAGLYAAIRV